MLKIRLLAAVMPLIMIDPQGAKAQEADQMIDAQAQAETPIAGEEEIIVTASKRAERLRDVPSAVTALSGDALEIQGVQDFRDYASLVPGLSQRDNGSPGSGTIIIRGLNTGAQQTTNTVAFYFDDTPFSSSGFFGVGSLVRPEPELADIDRIEVLKGPQGTLYGASSLGGLIRIISRRPDASAFSGSARAEFTTVNDGNEGFGLRASVNVPLVQDRLAARVTGFYRRYPGWADNVGTGNENVNDGHSVGGRLALRWTPIDDLSIDLVGLYQNIHSNGPAFQDNVSGGTEPLFGKRKFSNFYDPPNDVRYRLGSATIDYDFGPVSLVTMGSYAYQKLAFNLDYTPAYGIFLPLFGYPPGTGLAAPGGPAMKKLTLESRLISERLGRFEFILGGFYTRERNRYPIALVAVNTATGEPLPPPLGNFLTTLTLNQYEEVAGFGNLTFYITDRLDLTGGLRYASNDQTSDNIRSGLLAAGPGFSFESSDSATTYLATLRWRPTDTISTFLRAASGYRPGGPQSNPNPPPGAQSAIEPDKVWNYEAGVRGDFLDKRLSIAASIYHIDWSNIQLNTLAGGFVLQANGGDAKVDGFEVELQARPVSGMSIGATAGYTNARISRIEPGPSAFLGAQVGDQLPLTPRWTAALYGDHEFPLNESLRGSVGATLRHEGDKPSSFPNAPLDPSIEIPSITTLDLRAGLRFEGYSLQLRAENLFDRNGFTSLGETRVFPGQNVPATATLIRPRSFTVSLSADF